MFKKLKLLFEKNYLLGSFLSTISVTFLVYNFTKNENLIVTAITLCVFIFSLHKQNEAIKEQKILGAWQLLTTKAKGNSGKKEAIEFLIKQGIDLVGIDLSAEINDENRSKLDFRNGSYLYGLNLDVSKAILCGSNFKGSNLSTAIFKNADMFNVDFDNTDISCANFKKVNLFGASFKESNLVATRFEEVGLCGANFKDADLNNSQFKGSYLGGADFSGSSLTRADLKKSIGFEKAIFQNNYIIDQNTSNLPIAPSGYKFEFEGRVDGDKHYIKLVKTNSEPKILKTKQKLKPNKIKKLP